MKYLTYLLMISICGSSYACPELDNVDLANGEDAPVYEESSSSTVHLTEDEFYSMPQWAGLKKYDAYSKCKDGMIIKTLKHKTTGRVFKAITSNHDNCDGGNSIGALYSENLVQRLGDIGDSFISCYKKK